MKFYFPIFFIIAFFLTKNASAQDYMNEFEIQSSSVNRYYENNSGYMPEKILNSNYSNIYYKPKIYSAPKVYETARQDLLPNPQIQNQNFQNYNNYSKSKNSLKNFNDGKGVGYRVYDNSNRQSYFCDLDRSQNRKFSHDDNFNGVYFGIGANFVRGNLSIDEEYIGSTSALSNNSTISKFSHSISGNSVVPSILIGQGRLFSNGLFLGQEMSLMIGDFTIKKDKIYLNAIKSGSASSYLEKFMFKSSNFSYYSGKFGVNIFKRFIPYIKAGLSFGKFTYISQLKGNNRVASVGSAPTFVFGGGIDVSFIEHFRLMIDHSIFSNSMDSTFPEYDVDGAKRTINADININITRLNLVYKF